MIDYNKLFQQLRYDAETIAALGAAESDTERTATLLKWMYDNDAACKCGQETGREFFEHDDSCPVWIEGLEQYKENGGV